MSTTAFQVLREERIGLIARTPVTIAWGTRDAVLPFPQSRRARAVLPSARHITLKGCGHLPFADDPEAGAAAVLSAATR